MTGNARQTFRAALKDGGVWYTMLFAGRAIVDRLRDRLDDRLAGIEQRRSLVAPWTISARRFSMAENRALWNDHDWSSLGEEWTKSAEWKRAILEGFLEPNVPAGGAVVEIGPGGGRWTDVLRQRCAQVTVVDVSDRALQLCRDRFADSPNIEYLLADGGALAIPDASADAVWSYDVFVHINPVDAQRYFREFARILKPGARAVIHHPGAPLAGDRAGAWRSDLTEPMVRAFCREHGLTILSQTREHVNEGDVLSVIVK